MARKAQKKVVKKRHAKRQREPQKVYIPIHNQALFNQQRDAKIAESIKARVKEDETLTQIQIEDLRKRRKELLRV